MNYLKRQINASITRKLIFYILGVVLVMNVTMLVIIGMRSTGEANNFAGNYAVSQSEGIASNVNRYMEQAFETTNTLANTLRALRFATGVSREAIETILINVLSTNEEYIAVWTSWEPNAFDGQDAIYMDDALYEESDGRFSLSYYLEDGFVTINWGTLDDYDRHYYQVPKERKTKTILNPYYRTYTQDEADNVLITSVVTPVLAGNDFLGVVGVDIALENMNALVENVNLFETGTAVILSNDMRVAAHRDPLVAGSPLQYLLQADVSDARRAIESAEYYSFEDRTLNGVLRTFVPIEFADIAESWSVMTEIPLREITASSRNLLILIVLIGFAGLFVISLVVYLAAQSITRPIMQINDIVGEVALGKLNGSIVFDKRGDEVGQIAKGIKRLLEGLKETAGFARKIGDGNYDEQHAKLSDDDELGEALLTMQLSLKNAKQEELRRKSEDDIRNWITRGQAVFADIARQNMEDVSALSYLIISKLVKYMEVNQGGLFLVNTDDATEKFIELSACYAYDRRKYLNKRIEIGEGLVGACYKEKKYIYLEKVPDSYMKITSGLGGQNPGALLIVPLMINEEVFGVIELASFKSFKAHEIEFVEKVAEIIASAISNMRVASHTKALLLKSQQQAEEMRAQEEEMRQNMEELNATQEAMSSKEQLNQKKIKELTLKIDQLSDDRKE